MPRALVSVSDKTGIVDFGRGLASRGFEIVSTGGTARVLSEAGLTVTNVADVTGFPEMMDGRVKTLHPALHAGILARRSRADDLAALERHGLRLIDLVVVNLYPFVQAASNPATPFDALIEEVDIGGPSLVRAAAKNFRDVLVVVDSADYPALLNALDETPSLGFRFELARKALAHTAAYDTAITATLATVSLDGDTFARRDEPDRADGPRKLDSLFSLDLQKVRDLRYGENPHQRAAWYRPHGKHHRDQPAGFGAATFLQGKELSYTNLLDLDAALRIVLEFTEPAAAVIKHTNPCGVASGQTAAEAYIRARDTDKLAAYGGIVAVNRIVDVGLAEAVISTFIEAVIAPGVEPDALEILSRKTNMRVVTTELSTARGESLELRSILGAVLVQDRDRVVEAAEPWRTPSSSSSSSDEQRRVVSKRQPTPDEWLALGFAWRVCAHVKSNAVIFTDSQKTVAIGAGQMSRVDAVEVAVAKAQRAERSLVGSVAASDAYFPFRDGLDALARAGATAVVQPGGSVRDHEVIAAADEHSVAMVFTGRRHFRH
jgi:phosphoribosylaminoimidazolecarboxamide formyltransferase/IMP cyclohydrolase